MKLQFEQIIKNYKDKKVLKGISVTMGTGVYGLLGPNGAGKTTMIRIMADVLRPSKGQVLYGGKDIHTIGDDYRAKIGYLPQDVSFYGDFTGKDYLEYSASLKGMEKKHAKKRIEELAHNVGLQDDMNRHCSAYSGGMQRRLGIAQALLDNPEILILDEPTSGLDPHERIKFRNIISAYSKDRLVLLSTHIVSDVEHIATQIMMMEYGVIQHTLTSEEYIKMTENYVWLVAMPAEQLVEYQNHAVISNVIAKGDCMEVRVIDESKPAGNAVQAVPNLEDAYLYIFNYLPAKVRR
jgi:ABC-2 type transport system ATP-binding protein